MRILILLCCLIILTACAATGPSQATQQSWIGKSANSLVASLGQPNLTDIGPNGTTIYAYASKVYHSNLSTDQRAVTLVTGRRGQAVSVPEPPAYALYSSPALVTCTTIYVANAQGIITAVRNKGNGCY